MRLLMIEDYQPLRQSVCQGLREAGYAVDATHDGEEGLWFAQTNEYDAIILDLMLPGRDGLSILQQLRTEGRAVHILILTAKDTVEDRIRGLDLGADDYLVKPFVFEELLARVRALVRRSYQQKKPLLQIGPMQIDLTAQIVTVKGNVVSLTAREYALLEYLAMRADEVVSRSDIWEHLYEFKDDASSNVVDVYIGYLRRKIECESEVPILHTVRGRGYKLGIQS